MKRFDPGIPLTPMPRRFLGWTALAMLLLIGALAPARGQALQTRNLAYVGGSDHPMTAAGLEAAIGEVCDGKSQGFVYVMPGTLALGRAKVRVPHNCDISGSGQWTKVTTARRLRFKVHDMVVVRGDR